MQNELAIVRAVSQRLNAASIGHMPTGSRAMNFHAQPHMTHNIHVVVALRHEDAGRVVNLFSPDDYVSRAAVDNSIAHQTLFNHNHNESVIKVDCLIRKQNEDCLNAFNRRQNIKIQS